jgi:hypothetical protein
MTGNFGQMNVAKKIACSTIYFLNKKQKREFKKTEKCFSAPAEKNVFFYFTSSI